MFEWKIGNQYLPGKLLAEEKNGAIIKMKTPKQILSFQVGDKVLAAVVL